MNHTPEPWAVSDYVSDNDGCLESVITALDGSANVAVALDFGDNIPFMRGANARRIVACVNACRGYTTEQLACNILEESDLHAGAGHALALALECLINDCQDLPTQSKWWDIAQQALADWHGLWDKQDPTPPALGKDGWA
jgi:hypothetical protein